MGLFADDTKCFKKIESASGATIIQKDLDNIFSWSKEVHLNFNMTKCKARTVSRKFNPYLNAYCLNEHTILSTKPKVDLGVLINSKLDWKDHVCEVCIKANKLLGLVRCTTLEINDTLTRRSLYLQLGHSDLAYASQVWCPRSVELIRDVKKIQRRATKYDLGQPFTTEVMYVSRLQKLDLLPMSYWHEYLDMIFLFKVINGCVHMSKDANPVCEIYHTTRSSNNPSLITLKIPFARTVSYQSRYLIRASILWNCLSDNLSSKVACYKKCIN